MENNFLAITGFGAFHVYFADGCIYIRKYDGSKWSMSDTVISDAVNDFDVCCTNSSLYLLCEKKDGSLYYASYTQRERSGKSILSSRSGNPQITGIRLAYAGGKVHAFYVLNYDSKKLLIHHLPSSLKTPSVLAQISSAEYSLLTDMHDNINLFFYDSGKNIQCRLKSSNSFVLSEPLTELSAFPLSLCCFGGKTFSLCSTDGKINVHTNFGDASLLSTVVRTPITEIFCFNRKLYAVLWTPASINVFVSEDEGKTFSKLMPQMLTRTPRLKTLKIRKEGFAFTLPCNAERGYVRSMVIPFEKLIQLSAPRNDKNSDITARIKLIEKELSDLKQLLNTKE